MLLLFTSYLFANIVHIGTPCIFLYGLYIFHAVYAFAELMDRDRYALMWEIVKNLLGYIIILRLAAGHHADGYLSWATDPIICCFYLNYCNCI